MNPSILLLSGPPGAGKSTVAKELVASSVGPTVCIEGDKFWSFFQQSLKTKTFRTMLWSIAAAAMPCAKAGYETIIDFSIPLWFIDPLRTRFSEMYFDYVVIRPAEAICAERAAARSEGAITDYSGFREFYADFDAPKTHLVTDETSSPAALAAIIRQGLAEGRFRLPLLI